MGIRSMQTALSSLANVCHKRLSMLLRKIYVPYKTAFAIALYSCCCLAFLWTGTAKASDFAQVTVSTAAPAGLIDQWLGDTTAKYLANVVTNPFSPRTYAVTLIGPNPAYNPPPTTLEQALSLGATVYLYGWGNGIDYQRWHTLGHFNNMLVRNQDYMVNCSTMSAPFWNGLQVSTMTNQVVSIDSTTCSVILSAIYNDTYQEFFSTPPAPTSPEPMPVIDPLTPGQ